MLGKCYESITENFIPRPRKPRIDMDTDNPETFVGVNTEDNAMSSKTSKDDQNSQQGLDKTQHVSVSQYRSIIVQLFEIGNYLPFLFRIRFILFYSVLYIL